MNKTLFIATAGLAVMVLPIESVLGEAGSRGTMAPIPLPNVEDMAVLPGGRWLIANSMRSNDVKAGLYAVETATARFEQLYPARVAIAERPVRSHDRSRCPGKLTAGEFSGHGISYRPISARVGELYVVNHGGRESIEIFDVELPGQAGVAPKLRWRDCVLAPAGTVGMLLPGLATGESMRR